MEDIDHLDHSSDWLSTALNPLSAIESLLLCQVCREFLRDPLITECCHTFCSICIHRCLTHDGLCPTCRTGTDRSKLRKNTGVKELVETFKEARPKLLEHARASAVTESQSDVKGKRKAQGGSPNDVRHQAPRTATLRSRKAIKTSDGAIQEARPVESINEEDEDRLANSG